MSSEKCSGRGECGDAAYKAVEMIIAYNCDALNSEIRLRCEMAIRFLVTGFPEAASKWPVVFSFRTRAAEPGEH